MNVTYNEHSDYFAFHIVNDQIEIFSNIVHFLEVSLECVLRCNKTMLKRDNFTLRKKSTYLDNRWHFLSFLLSADEYYQMLFARNNSYSAIIFLYFWLNILKQFCYNRFFSIHNNFSYWREMRNDKEQWFAKSHQLPILIIHANQNHSLYCFAIYCHLRSLLAHASKSSTWNSKIVPIFDIADSHVWLTCLSRRNGMSSIFMHDISKATVRAKSV